jgi:hypothetical protein
VKVSAASLPANVNPAKAEYWADEMLKRVKEEKKQSAQTAKLMAGQKRAEIEKINLRLQKLLESFLDEVIDRETYVAAKAKEMSQKKSLEEQSTALLRGRADWLEPFQSWILTARNAGETVINGSLQQKRVLAKQVFGSNLVLDCKKARGSCVKPWSLLVENSSSGGMEPMAGIEPATDGLRNRCSTTELHWLNKFVFKRLCDNFHFVHDICMTL